VAFSLSFVGHGAVGMFSVNSFGVTSTAAAPARKPAGASAAYPVDTDTDLTFVRNLLLCFSFSLLVFRFLRMVDAGVGRWCHFLSLDPPAVNEPV
jgi:hypothetical protein